MSRVSNKAISLAHRLTRLRNGPASTITVPSGLDKIEMTFAFRNRDYGARKFMKLDLPSILYKNPRLKVDIQRPEKVEKPSMILRYSDGSTKTISLKNKSDEIIREELRGTLAGTLPSSMKEPLSSSAPTTRNDSTSPTTQVDPPKGVPPEGELEAGVDYGTARQ